jgi:hypothetical protein
VTITASAVSKAQMTRYNFLGSEFTASGLLAGDTVTRVSFSCKGARQGAPSSGSPYTIIPSMAVISSPVKNTYKKVYVNGLLTISSDYPAVAPGFTIPPGRTNITGVSYTGICPLSQPDPNSLRINVTMHVVSDQGTDNVGPVAKDGLNAYCDPAIPGSPQTFVVRLAPTNGAPLGYCFHSS